MSRSPVAMTFGLQNNFRFITSFRLASFVWFCNGKFLAIWLVNWAQDGLLNGAKLNQCHCRLRSDTFAPTPFCACRYIMKLVLEYRCGEGQNGKC